MFGVDSGESFKKNDLYKYLYINVSNIKQANQEKRETKQESI